MNTKIDTIKKWIEKADHDLGTAILTFTYIAQYRDTIAFHCQQATEKYLKSYLIYLDIEFPIQTNWKSSRILLKT